MDLIFFGDVLLYALLTRCSVLCALQYLFNIKGSIEDKLSEKISEDDKEKALEAIKEVRRVWGRRPAWEKGTARLLHVDRA